MEDKEFINNPVAAYEKLMDDYAELKAENFELKENLKCFQTPEAIKALTFYKTGEFELQEKKCIELEQENARLKNERTADLVKQIEELKAENEQLKAENEELCERMAAVTYRATGGRLSYSNYTLDAIEEAFYDQLDILSDKKIEPYKQTLQEIKDYLNTLSGIDNDFVNTETYLRILDCITKAEEE